MTHPYTPAQLEAWAGLGPWRVHPGANSHLFDGTIVDQSDSALAFVHACLFQDEDNGVYGATVSRSGELMVAAPDLARLVLEKDAEIARLKAAAGDLVGLCHADVKMNGTTYQPTPYRSAFTKAVENLLEAINGDRQAMKETSDE